MAKPPETPPSSDIDGADEDRQRIDQAKNSDPRHAEQLRHEEEEGHGRPKPSRS